MAPGDELNYDKLSEGLIISRTKDCSVGSGVKACKNRNWQNRI